MYILCRWCVQNEVLGPDSSRHIKWCLISTVLNYAASTVGVLLEQPTGKNAFIISTSENDSVFYSFLFPWQKLQVISHKSVNFVHCPHLQFVTRPFWEWLSAVLQQIFFIFQSSEPDLRGYWTTHGYANSRIADSRTGQVADWTTRGCHQRLSVLSFHSLGGICEATSCPVCELAYPWVVQLPSPKRAYIDRGNRYGYMWYRCNFSKQVLLLGERSPIFCRGQKPETLQWGL